MQPDYDDLDDLDEGGFNWMLVMVLLLAVAGFFSLAWYAYQTGSQQETSGEVVVIQADPSPIKETPKDPGGREFPHQEKTIYEAVRPDGTSSVEIQLQPEPETPSLEQAGSTSADKKVTEILQRAVKDAQKKSVSRSEAEQIKAQPAEKPKPFNPPKEQAPEPTPAPAPKAEPKPEKKATPSLSGERVQLGAFRSRIEAEKQWQKVQRAHDSLLKGKPHEVIRADLGSKGVFYRLRVGGLADKPAAKSLCKTLSARGQGCFVVR